MKLIGLDVGTKRIGVAVADSNVRIAVPNGTIIVNGNELTEIIKIARLNNTEWFVLGLPRSNQGNTTAQSVYVQDFADKLLRVFPSAKIRFQDESLTSVEAEERLKARKRRYGKEEIDAEAAAIILQDFIENFKIVGGQAATPKPPVSTSVETPAVKPTPKPVKPAKPAKKKGAPMPKKIFLFFVALLLILGVGGFVAYGWYNAALEAMVGAVNCDTTPENEACTPVDFIVSEGESLEQIANNLKSAGLIKDSLAFQIYARFHGIADQLRTGRYQLNRTMTTPEIAIKLIEGGSSDNVFSLTIYPGETVRDVKKALIDKGYAEEEVNTAFSKIYDHPVLEGKPVTNDYGAEPLEGYMFSETYEFYKGEPVENIIKTSLDAYYKAVQNNDLINKFSARGLTLYQGITLASIVQKEGFTKEFAHIAQVFYTRLSQNHNLGSDVTIKYILDVIDPERQTYNNNAIALEVDSPYNTRRYIGLPPGPICNPSVAALNGVAEPTNTSDYYFLTGDDGVMYYSTTEQEHQQNMSHCQNLCNVSL